MRFLTGAVIAGAVILIVAVAISLRIESETEPGQVDPIAASPSRSSGGRPAAAPRSRRVQERLGRLRDDYDRRRSKPVASANRVDEVQARTVVVPMDKGRDVQPHVELDPDDVEEFEEIKETLLHDPDPDERVGAILMLTGIEGDEAWHLLVDVMQDPDPEVRLAAVEALGDYTEEISPDVLSPALNDVDPEVRFEAYGILGDMESQEALSLVRNGMSDSDEDVRALSEGILEFADDE
jgi:hypothetical protein